MSPRRATEADRERWLELRAGLYPELALDRHDAAIGRLLASAARRAAFVYAPADAATASGFVEVSRDGDDAGIARVDALYVVPGERRRGVGRALLEAASDWASRSGCRTLQCAWPLADEPAHAGLRALGFDERGREVRYSRTLHPAMALAGARSTDGAGAAAPAPAAARATPAAASVAKGGWWVVHGLVICAGAASLLNTDIFSGDVVRGALLPLVDVLFVAYLVALFATRHYRRRTDASDRAARLFDGPIPQRRGNTVNAGEVE